MIPLAAPEAFGAGGGVDFLRSGHGASGFLLDAIGDGVAAYLARLHCCLLALLAVAGLQPSAFSRQLSDSQVLKHAYFRPWKRQWQPPRRFSIRSTPKPALAYISFYNARRLPVGVLARSSLRTRMTSFIGPCHRRSRLCATLRLWCRRPDQRQNP